MGISNLFEDDLLDLLFTGTVAGPSRTFPFGVEEPRLFDAIIGTIFIMTPITAFAYYTWQWLGWL